jgi:dTDP-4-amino-4,6-dideoxygalactose transaminase
MIPFSPPRIDQQVIDEVTAALTSGWITTGPRTKLFEKQLTEYCGNHCTVAVSSWTAGMELLLRWWGIGPGDEVIVPAITYCASANVVVHTGATPVMVDVHPGQFIMDTSKLEGLITERTKAIMPVDIAGFPCDYDAIFALVNKPEIKQKFKPNGGLQQKLGRILIAADAAHSFGSTYKGKRSGALADVTCFSFHAVKNLTTAEGGTMSINLPEGFDHDEIYKELCMLSLHGQSKDALAKTQKGNWRYDVLVPGFKCNMTDIQAAIGLVELGRFQENLDRRQAICEAYNSGFSSENWALLPVMKDADRESCYHLYQLRIDGANESQRDAIIQAIFDQDVSVNVHFQPLPILTAYRNLGYKMEDYPEAWKSYENEITLPVYYDLTNAQVQTVITAVKQAVKQILG